jgi:hypothetical protein
MVQPEALSFSAAMSVVMSGLSSPGDVRFAAISSIVAVL